MVGGRAQFDDSDGSDSTTALVRSRAQGGACCTPCRRGAHALGIAGLGIHCPIRVYLCVTREEGARRHRGAAGKDALGRVGQQLL